MCQHQFWGWIFSESMNYLNDACLMETASPKLIIPNQKIHNQTFSDPENPLDLYLNWIDNLADNRGLLCAEVQALVFIALVELPSFHFASGASLCRRERRTSSPRGFWIAWRRLLQSPQQHVAGHAKVIKLLGQLFLLAVLQAQST